jgi:hypothetical protein
MPIKPCPYFDPNEPSDDAEVRRYLTMFKFQDLMANEELYFARPDGFSDKAEGIPSRERVAAMTGANRYDIQHWGDSNHTRGSFAQFREMYFISCWTLHRNETYRMWSEYAWDRKRGGHGLAIRTTYGRLKSALDRMMEDICVGKVVYGKDNLVRPGNVWCEITSKDTDFAWESEIRAMLQWSSGISGGNLHIDANNQPHPEVLEENPRYHWNHNHKLRRIDLKALATGIVISPWATQAEIDEINLWVSLKKHFYPIDESEKKNQFMPSHEEYLEKKHLWK